MRAEGAREEGFHMSFVGSDKLRDQGRTATKAFALLCAALLCLWLALGMGGCTSEEEEEEEDDYDYTSTYSQYDYDSGSEDEEEDEDEEVEEAEEDEGSEEVEEAESTYDPLETRRIMAENTLNEDDIPIAEGLPYKGMDELYINVTWLGECDDSEEVEQSGGIIGGSTAYYWNADNGTGDRVFTAWVKDGSVVKILHDNSDTDYWVGDDGFWMDYPDLDASGTVVKEEEDYSSSDDDADYPDTDDYSSAEEYADEAQGDFEAAGSDDPWNDAYDYWWDNY